MSFKWKGGGWGANSSANKTGTTTTFGNKTGTTATTTTFGKTGFGAKPAPSTDIRNVGIELKPAESPVDPINDTINDLCINDHYVVCAASWSGLKLWKNVPKNEPTSNTTQTFASTKINPYNFESFEGELIQNGLLNPHTEPIIRCTFDTLQNNVIYFGNVYGQIWKVCIENVNEHAREDLLGHQTSIITGLKYCRDKRAIASSSCEGHSYIWDPRKGNYQCAEIETKINCTNLDFVQNTIAICGIDNEKFTPVVKLYDIRNITNPLPPPPTKTNSFFKTTTTTTTTSTSTSSFYKPPKPYSEIVSYSPGGDEINKKLVQFTSIVLDRSGKKFVAGTIGGYIISSKSDGKNFEENVLIKETARKVTQKTGYGTQSATTNVKSMDANLNFRAINGLAMVQAPIRANKISAHPIFAATSCGSVVSFTGFKTNETTGELPINVIKQDYVSPKPYPVTAIAVSPNGKMLTYAYGDDYREGCRYRFFTSDDKGNHTMMKAECRIKMVDVSADFNVKEARF